MKKKQETGAVADNQELHHAARACVVLREAAYQLAQAGMEASARIVRNLAASLERGIAQARHEAAADLVLVVRPPLLMRDTPPSKILPENREGGGTPAAARSEGEGIYSDDLPEKKAAASGGDGNAGVATCEVEEKINRAGA